MKKNYKIGVGIVVLVALLVAGLILLRHQKDGADVIVDDQEVIVEGEITFDKVKEVSLLKYPIDASMEEIMARTVSGEVAEIFSKGDLLVAEVLMELTEGIVYSVTPKVVDVEGRDVVSTGRNLGPLEVRGGGTFSVCCFEVFQTGNFNFLLLIDGNEVARVPFRVKPEE